MNIEISDKFYKWVDSVYGRAIHFNVDPRFTPGSPALVNQEIAERVALQEKQAHEHYLEGIYGEDAKATAISSGLSGIVEARAEQPRKRKEGWAYFDLVTGESGWRPAREPGEGDVSQTAGARVQASAAALVLQRAGFHAQAVGTTVVLPSDVAHRLAAKIAERIVP